jgi:hypothetical protein
MAAPAMTLARRQSPASRPHPGQGATAALFGPVRRALQGEDSPEISKHDLFDAIQKLAPHIFVLLMDSSDAVVCQAAGRAARTFLGPDAKGKKFYGLWTETSQKNLRRYFAISARKRRAFCAMSSSHPNPATADRCTLFIPAFSDDSSERRFIAITFRTQRRTPGAPSMVHLRQIAFFPTRTAGEEKTSQSTF